MDSTSPVPSDPPSRRPDAAAARSARLRRFALALLAALLGCGDGVFIIAVNSGVIVGPPRCDGRRGEFDMRGQGGLQVLVLITSSTRIVVSSGTGSCADLHAGQPVDVSGRQSGDQLVAGTVTVRQLRP